MHRLAVASLLLIGVVTGCSSHPSATTSQITYWKSVKPIADAKCVGCHTANNIAPFTLLSFADFKAHTDLIRVAVTNRVMPPWPAKKDCTDYQADRSLSDAEIATVNGWIDGGAVEGDPKDYVAGAPSAAGLTRVDRTISLPAPYTPTLSPDEYRCFLIDWPETATKYVSGFRAHPGNANIVHHTIAFLAQPADVADYQALDDADPAPGWVCFGGPGGKNDAQAHWLGAWAPGSLGSDYPAATGIKVLPGSKVVLQVHYNLAKNDNQPDQTSVDFKLDDSVTKEALIQPWANPAWVQQHQMVIPAGAGDQMYNWTFAPSSYFSYITGGVIPSSVPVTMWSASLHMHTRGTRAQLAIQHADGSKECMLDIEKWDFHWQGAYDFQQPKMFQPSDSLYLECHFDNSDSATDRNWGEGTSDEMCLGGFYVTP